MLFGRLVENVGGVKRAARILPELKMQAGRLVACHAVEQDLGTP